MRKKQKLFNKNSTPFLLLGVTHLCMFLILLKRKKQRDVWILLLSNIGFAYLFEYLTLNLFHGYQYKPKLMKKYVFDSILGAIFSQAFYVPIAATFITLLNKDWKWKVNFSIFYYLIEIFFLRLHIYKVSWWKPLYTPVLLYVYFYISDGFYKAVSTQKRWALAIAHYFAIDVVWVTYMFVSASKRLFRFGRGYFHTWTEHFEIVPLYVLILSFIATLTSSKAGILSRLPLLLFHIILDITLVKMGVLKLNFKPSLLIGFRYLLMPFFSRFYYKKIHQK